MKKVSVRLALAATGIMGILLAGGAGFARGG